MPVPPSRPEGHRTLVRLGLAAAVGVLLGLALVLPRSADSASPRLRLYGEDLPAGAEGIEAGVLRAERSLDGWFNLTLPDGGERRTANAQLGVALDRARLRRMIRDTSSAVGFTPTTGVGRSTEGIDLAVPVVLERARALTILLALKEELDQPPADARLALDSAAVIPERAGRRLDVDCSLAAIESALQRGAAAASLCFQYEPPRRRASELAGVRHEVLLGFYETRLDPDRSHLGAGSRASSSEPSSRLQLAAARLDGYVVMPGTVFDFNAALGRLDEAHEVRAAAATIARGERVDGADVSASPIAGALHAAALFAGLDVVERHLPERPSPIDVGLDAAVAYPVTNLRLKNRYVFPVVLRAQAR